MGKKLSCLVYGKVIYIDGDNYTRNIDHEKNKYE